MFVCLLVRADCTEACKARRREIECQIKQVRRDLQQRDEQFLQMESEIRILRQYKETNNVEVLMSALNAMQDKNQHLESSLSDETRIKLDLFSALGNAKRQLEITNSKNYFFFCYDANFFMFQVFFCYDPNFFMF